MMRLHKTIRRLLAIVLALNLSLSLVSVPALADEVIEPDGVESTLICGKEEHTHDASCYGERVLACGKDESEGHTHTEECVPTTGKELVCELEEAEGHVHTDECYGEPVRELTCGKEESEGHTHGEGCYTSEKSLTCQIPEDHHHTVECYQIADPDTGMGTEMEIDGQMYVVEGMNCTIPEGHIHDDTCYTEEQVLTCELEEAEGHEHTDECYTETKPLLCGQEETEGHTHNEDCYAEVTTYSCGQEESEAHRHTDACYQLFCGMEEHAHTAECYDAEGNLVCEVPEHAHGDLCYRPLICGLEEHEHDETCYASVEDEPSADVPQNEEGGGAPGTDGTDAEETGECICKFKCTEDFRTTNCPVCKEDISSCTATETIDPPRLNISNAKSLGSYGVYTNGNPVLFDVDWLNEKMREAYNDNEIDVSKPGWHLIQGSNTYYNVDIAKDEYGEFQGITVTGKKYTQYSNAIYYDYWPTGEDGDWHSVNKHYDRYDNCLRL